MIDATERARPFSNGTQFLDWESSNCDKCQRDIAQCPISQALTLACFDDGTVSPDIAKRMGYTDYGWVGEYPRYGWPCLEHEPPFDLDEWQKGVRH